MRYALRLRRKKIVRRPVTFVRRERLHVNRRAATRRRKRLLQSAILGMTIAVLRARRRRKTLRSGTQRVAVLVGQTQKQKRRRFLSPRRTVVALDNRMTVAQLLLLV